MSRMIVEQGRYRTVNVRRRHPETLERIEEQIKGQYPYLFVRDSDVERAKSWGLVSDTESGYEGVYGEALTKLSCRESYDVRDISRTLKDTWEANIPHTNQVLTQRLLDRLPAYPNYEHRIWFLDGEWKKDSGEITILTVLDSYTGDKYTWFTHPDYPMGDYRELPCVAHPDGIENITFGKAAKAFSDERSLLKHFVEHMNKQDPDVLAGWFLTSADIQQIAKRMEANGLSPKLLSPYRRHRYKYAVTDKKWEQPIPGRLCIDLMVAFKKLWVLKNGQLPGQSLNVVADHCLNETKVDLPNGHDTYYDDVGTYIAYNVQDVDLLPKLNGLVNCIDYYLSTQHLVQCDFPTVPLTTGVATSLFRRDPDFKERIPTKPQFEKVDYDAAHIQEPEPGLYEATAIFDIRAMYHSNVKLHNICWTTLDPTGEDCGNGTSFSQDKQGLLGRAMDYLTDQRDIYKKNMKGAANKKEKTMWDSMQFATKSLVASLYGVSGDARYGLYNPEIAASITHTSRETLHKLRKLCEGKGHRVCYQHTDSCFVNVATQEEAYSLTGYLNEEMSPVVVEFEKYASSLIMKAKNRYAARVVWADGEWLGEPDYYVKGIELIQARMPTAMKSALMRILKGMLDGEEQQNINKDLTEMITHYLDGKDCEDLFMRTTLKKNLWEYKVLSGPSAGAEWAYHNLDYELSKGDDFIIALDNRGKYIGFPSLDYLPAVEKRATIGYRMMLEKFVVDKANDLYSIVDWDSQPLYNALDRKGMVMWL